MNRLDLELIIDNSIKGFGRISTQLTAGDNLSNMKRRELSTTQKEPKSLNESYTERDLFNETYETDITLSDKDWSQLLNLFDINAGMFGSTIVSKKYNDVPYYEMIYNPRKYNNIPSREDIELFNIVGGNVDLFKHLSPLVETNPDIIIAGSSHMKEDDINNIESFFEIYDSKNSLLTGKVEEISRWKDISTYDEFLQQPLLKEGKDFMNKFLDIQTRVEAGEIIPREEIETLVPMYMKDGESLLVTGGLNLDLANAVDPEYSLSSYLLSNDTSDMAKDLIHAAFMRTFFNLRVGTLGDLKRMINNIGDVVKQINRTTKKIISPLDCHLGKKT